MHVSRYIHLNPVTAMLIEDPGEWKWTSYNEYINKDVANKKICNFDNYLEFKNDSYRKFVLEQKDYQRELARIKKMLLD
ncbi:MAG: hypothetical protein HQL25_03675 [Candidatus Omnitrophica bacterium]|nr:hypothetical protein [Candidatus Omnitrophota bacterium]